MTTIETPVLIDLTMAEQGGHPAATILSTEAPERTSCESYSVPAYLGNVGEAVQATLAVPGR